jgi:hypothetical protein
MVSATNERDVKLVQSVGKEIKIKYQPNAYFNSDKQIYLYEWICNNWLADFTFEVMTPEFRIGLLQNKKQ